MKNLGIFGSTGTIGTQTLDLVDQFPGQFRVVALAAGRNIQKLSEQIQKYQPEYVCSSNEGSSRELRSLFPKVKFLFGEVGLCELSKISEIEIVVMGLVGFAALKPTIAAIKAKKTIALANKESLVVAGGIVMEEVRRQGVTCIPVDSEHSALFQLLEKTPAAHVRSIVLTASGGPFF